MIETQEQTRIRTYSWSDPRLTAAHVGQTAGLDMLQAMQRGERPPPPIMDTVGMDSFEATEGRAVFTMRAQEYHYNLLGTVHGGVIATLLDSAAGCAVHTTLPAGWGYTSLDLSTKFLRPATVDSEQLRCEGTVMNRGRTTALAEARLLDGAGRLLAHATSTCVLFPISG